MFFSADKVVFSVCDLKALLEYEAHLGENVQADFEFTESVSSMSAVQL